MSNQYDYDAVIIGAGISGLVCGCYLAKAGMKVLIIEKTLNQVVIVHRLNEKVSLLMLVHIH